MPPSFEDLEEEMDAQVEIRLGDAISYTRAGGAPTTIRGFINLDSDDGGIEGVDPMRRRWIVSINMSRLPDGPKPTDRLTHKKLRGVMFKPSTGTITNDGRDYFFNIQKA